MLESNKLKILLVILTLAPAPAEAAGTLLKLEGDYLGMAEVRVPGGKGQLLVFGADQAKPRRNRFAQLFDKTKGELTRSPTVKLPADAAGYDVCKLDPASATDTVLVRARIPVTGGLRPGQFVNVNIAVEEHSNRLAVPVESVVQGPDGPEIALVQGDTAVKTRVTLGLRDGNRVEVDGQGVREGIPVVVRGAYGLPPRTKVKVSAQ